MSVALTEASEFDCALVGPALNEVAGSGPLSLQPLGGGRNSRVYRVDRSDRNDAEVYVAKIYSDTDPKSTCDRRGREFAALRFLWNNDVRCIPEPIATFPEQSLSILRFVEGTPLTRDDVKQRDVEALVEFLIQLDRLKLQTASFALGAASEACFSLDALAESIRARLAHLQVAADLADTRAHERLQLFLAGSIRPVLARAFESAAALQRERGLEIDSVLARESRTLSPSDFGFHNALRRPDGSLVFVDFEHFGWDDPAKMVSDFLLHPALPLSVDLRRQFMQSAIARHPACTELDWRVPLAFPLYAIKWCTILLNEFVPEQRQRRAFALHRKGDSEAVLLEQLAKAKSLLESATEERGEFPYAA